TQAGQCALALAQVFSHDGTGNGQQAFGDGGVYAGPVGDGSEEGQTQHGVFTHVAVFVQVDLLAPVAAFHQLGVRRTVAIHPLVVFVVVGQGEVRGTVAQRFTNAHALVVQLRGHGTYRGL